MFLGISNIREQCKSAVKCHCIKLKCKISKYLCMTLMLNTLCICYIILILTPFQKFRSSNAQRAFGSYLDRGCCFGKQLALMMQKSSDSAAFHHQMALIMHACEKLLTGG
jgi:hypothetical protein